MNPRKWLKELVWFIGDTLKVIGKEESFRFTFLILFVATYSGFNHLMGGQQSYRAILLSVMLFSLLWVLFELKVHLAGRDNHRVLKVSVISFAVVGSFCLALMPFYFPMAGEAPPRVAPPPSPVMTQQERENLQRGNEVLGKFMKERVKRRNARDAGDASDAGPESAITGPEFEDATQRIIREALERRKREAVPGVPGVP